MTTRAYNVLKSIQVSAPKDLAIFLLKELAPRDPSQITPDRSTAHLLKLRHCGKETAKEIMDWLNDSIPGSVNGRCHHCGAATGKPSEVWHERLEWLAKSPDLLPAMNEAKPYDSTADTQAHIARVRALLDEVIERLEHRGLVHDESKLGLSEKPYFDALTSKLKGLTYGSDEYKQALDDLGPALAHHYLATSHHPEHFADGVYGMTLLDLIEMLADWKAAGERHADGSMARSLAVNKTRFNIDERLQRILERTANELGWV